MLDRELLQDFMNRFFGYGSWKATLWFVGMEEGGGNSIEEIEHRLAAWDRTDELADLEEFHAQIGGENWFAARPKIQSTWGKLIRILLAAQGLPSDTEAVRTYQRDRLGRHNGDVALIELLPLPSPSTSHWLYESTGIPSIRTRDCYKESLLPKRIETIRARIATHKPEAVVFYGMAYREHWEAIIDAKFVRTLAARWESVSKDGILFVLAPHPVATGVRNADFAEIGDWIRQHARPPHS